MIALHFGRLTAALLLLLVTACEPQPMVEVERAELDYKAEVFYRKDGPPFTGRMIKRHSDGSVRSKMELKKGVPHGLVVEFAENGTQIVEVHFEDGIRHGKNTYWYDDGSLMKEQWYDRDHEVEGKTVHYDKGEKPASPAAD